MKSSYFIPSPTLVGLCMWTLDLFGEESSSWDATTPPREVLTVGRRNVSIGPTALSNEFARSELSAANLTGIRYAQGKGVERNPRMAMGFFLRSAMKGYTPAMANVGTLYEIGAAGSPNLYRAYAWVRTALFFGVPEQDHDATVLKLGMIAARLGSPNTGAAERSARTIANRIVATCQCSPSQETELASNVSLRAM